MRISRRQNRRIAQGQAVRRNYWLWFAGVFVAVDTLALLSWGGLKLSDPNTLPIKEIRIEGAFHRLRLDELKARVAREIKGGFFALEVERIQEALLREPWVKEVRVARVWPDELRVIVSEHWAVAQWGNRGLLTAEGRVFSPPKESYPRGLPELEGPPGTEVQVLNKFYELSRFLNQVGWKPDRLSLSPRRAWSFQVVNGPTVLVGRADFEGRIRRFIASFRRTLGDQAEGLTQVDLRYANGFAVKSRSLAEDSRHG